MAINVDFQGYWSDSNACYIPNRPGIYCIYAGTDNGDSCILRNLLFIGESSDVGNQLMNMDKTELKEWLNWGETLFYSFAETEFSDVSEKLVAERNRQDLEKQLLYENIPPLNTNVPADDPGINIIHSGRNRLVRHCKIA